MNALHLLIPFAVVSCGSSAEPLADDESGGGAAGTHADVAGATGGRGAAADVETIHADAAPGSGDATGGLGEDAAVTTMKDTGTLEAAKPSFDASGPSDVGSVSAYDPCPTAGTPCLIMPLGDSITAGLFSTDGGG